VDVRLSHALIAATAMVHGRTGQTGQTGKVGDFKTSPEPVQLTKI
jgi:hypothetical protein